jgi:hypothetical protein
MTNRLSELVESYRLAAKQSPPPGHILVHGRVTARTPDFRAWWATPGEEYALMRLRMAARSRHALPDSASRLSRAGIAAEAGIGR